MTQTIIDDATKEEQDEIDSGLIRYNNEQAPFTQREPYVPLNRCIRQNGTVVGGISAQIYCWNVLCIDILWVKEEYRNKGYARALIEDVENKAKEMNCRIAHLDTFDFQARELYEKLGYTVFGVLDDCPDGHQRYYMSKQLK